MISFRQRHPARRADELYRSERDGQTCSGGVGRFDNGWIAEVVVNAAKPSSTAETSKRRGRPSGYTPEMCNQIISLMARGLSLTASAGVMGIGRTTVHRWMDAHEEFRDAALRSQAARRFKLETILLEMTSATVVRFCCLALVNSAPEEWRKKRITGAAQPLRA